MGKGIWTSCLGCQDGFHKESKVGPRWAQNARPDRIYFRGVVSHESVRIAFTYAALNGLQVFAADIRNSYLQAPSSQKDYIVCGPEFRIKNIGKVALIHRALYGGKSAGRDLRNHLRTCMHHLMFGCDQNRKQMAHPAIITFYNTL